MGRPDQMSLRINNNFNPVFHAQSEQPVDEKRVVQAEQIYPNNGGVVNQPNQVPMRPGPPTYINQSATFNQPYGVSMAGPVHTQPSNWTSGLFDCMNDGENALITCCFPFVTFGQIAEVIDEGATSCGTAGMLYGLICCLFAIPCVYTCTFRTKLRSKYGLPDAPAPDWITHCFCEYCALCQEYRELKNRGLDPSIGWIGNVQKQRMGQQQEMMAPPMGQRMMG
ncbi:Protein PLANT CADMIUM RESISTANCE 6 [Arabidopsis thaliana]